MFYINNVDNDRRMKNKDERTKSVGCITPTKKNNAKN